MQVNSFKLKDCAFAPIALGLQAETLREFRDRLSVIPVESIYYHFWRQSIETSLAPGSFYNDFSHWAHYHLHDDFLAERLALLDPSEYSDLETLRADIIEVIENRLDELEVQGSILVFPFHFIRTKIVVFNTPYELNQPEDLVQILPKLSRSSIFYHFIDARRRDENNQNDFSRWLKAYGDRFTILIQKLKQIDPYFIPLSDLQQKLTLTVTEYFLGNKNSND